MTVLMRGPERAGWQLWLPALFVAIGAVAATAHGLYEVALAARVPWGVALLYPLITDGLALVAYAATHRLRGWAAGYAWAVTVLAAALSGLAQAAYLASDPLVAGPELRFGVGAWPAIAAAIVAHLLYLLATPARPAPTVAPQPVPVRLVADAIRDRPPVPAAPSALSVVREPAVQAKATPPEAEPVDLAKVRRLVADGAGRGLVARELGVKPHVARKLVDQVRQS